MTTVLAVVGAKALYFLYVWLASAIIASVLSSRKGYGEKAGLATGLVLSAIAILVWLLWPPKADSAWKLQGAFGRKAGATSLAAERAKRDAGG
ncbi:MAG: hypothetical protein QOJ12_2921 [Thermoleophilales bacterium]|nr:hypothetical protein [Thermoleophilales bacterium]